MFYVSSQKIYVLLDFDITKYGFIVCGRLFFNFFLFISGMWYQDRPITPIPIFAQSVNVWNTSNSLWQLLASLWTCCFSKASIMLCSSLGTLVWLSFFEQYIVGVDSPNYILCDHEKRTQESKSKPLWVSFNSGASALRECAWINVIKRIRNKKSSR